MRIESIVYTELTTWHCVFAARPGQKLGFDKNNTCNCLFVVLKEINVFGWGFTYMCTYTSVEEGPAR